LSQIKLCSENASYEMKDGKLDDCSHGVALYFYPHLWKCMRDTFVAEMYMCKPNMGEKRGQRLTPHVAKFIL